MRATIGLFLAVSWPSAPHGDCAPGRMVKIVTRSAAPAVAGTFAAEPVTLYRYGAHYARREEEPDPRAGIHGLIVTNNRDTWMVNLADGTGQHIVDRTDSETLDLPMALGLDGPLPGLEFGCEIEYVRSRGIEPRTVRMTGKDLLEYEIPSGKDTVRLLIDPGTGTPWSVESVHDGVTRALLRYVEYETDLEPDLSLFEKPPGIAFVEGKPSDPDPLAGLDDLDDEILGYAQPTEDGTPAADCDSSGPHAGSSCPQPVADESDWHLESTPQGAAFWARQCRTFPEDMARLLGEASRRSKAFDECAPASCGTLAPDADGGDIRSRALRELLAVWLNTVSDRLDEAAGVREAIARLESAVCSPGATSDEVRTATAAAEALNTGATPPAGPDGGG